MADVLQQRAVLVCLLCAGFSVHHGVWGEAADRITLPRPEPTGAMSVEQAIDERRSIRDYRRQGLDIIDVAQLLWAAQGTTGRHGLRAAPSAGALYPLNLYVIVGDVSDLEPGVYSYRPGRHDLLRLASGDQRKALANAALDQDWVRRAPVVLAIVTVSERSAVKYGQRAHRYARIEAGHVSQNVYLQATAQGLGTVFVGSFVDAKVREVLQLPPDHEPLGLMPVGRPR
jgi:SagB-type dehydrogenase family enzyme